MRRFNAPPGWPQPPAGWIPPAGWQPDPSWPQPPPGWNFWVESAQVTQGQNAPDHRLHEKLHEPPAKRGGLLSGRRDLSEENAYLRQLLEDAGLAGALEVAREIKELEQERAALHAELRSVRTELLRSRASIVEYHDVAQLQEAGIYQYAHPLADAVGYKDLLDRVRRDTKDLVKSGRAVIASTNWHVEGSQAKGRQMTSEISRLLLRAYNAEADNCVRTVRPHTRAATLERLSKAAASIERLGRSMNIHISSEYHQVRLYEIELTADYRAKQEEEKERQREERARLREEQAAAREIEREKARLEKERQHYANALQRLKDGSGSPKDVAAFEEKLREIDVELDKVISREANIRAGWVYVISNVGSFGGGVVKIGMTRRLEPMDRVRELGDASVPFRFDVHALIFSNDAVSLETALHRRLSDRKLNQVNNAREFFFATPIEVKELLLDVDGGQHLLEYKEDAEAEEWRLSGARRARSSPDASDWAAPEAPAGGAAGQEASSLPST